MAAVVFGLVAIACAPSPESLALDAASDAAEGGLSLSPVDVGEATLMAALRARDGRRTTDGSVLTVYIEGDGRAFDAWRQPTNDPTPSKPVGLSLATADPAPRVAWLARPCQYGDAQTRSICADRSLWTDGRFSDLALDLTDRALDVLKARTGTERLVMAGFSGGGAIAALMAARRDDVDGLVTVAGVLDHEAFTQYHQVTPMSRSLNPPDFAEHLRDLPQRHFIGAEDDIVPGEIIQAYKRRLGSASCLFVEVVPEQGHLENWEIRWPELYRSAPTCNDRSGQG